MNKSAILIRAHKTARNLFTLSSFATYRAALSEGMKRAWAAAKEEAAAPAPSATPRMIYLDVPYSEKDKAKKAGARWDATARSWYVIACEVPFSLKRWENSTHSARTLSTADYV